MTPLLSRQFVTEPLKSSEQLRFLHFLGLTQLNLVFSESLNGKIFRSLELTEKGWVPTLSRSANTILVHHEGITPYVLSGSTKNSLWEKLCPAPLAWLAASFGGERFPLTVQPSPLMEGLKALWIQINRLEQVCGVTELCCLEIRVGDSILPLILQFHRGHCTRVGTTLYEPLEPSNRLSTHCIYWETSETPADTLTVATHAIFQLLEGIEKAPLLTMPIEQNLFGQSL